MTGHLENFVWAINPLHSSKAGSGCEVKPGWKGQAVLSVCVFVPGGTEGHLHASLLIMGICISPWGATPTWQLFARTGTAGMTQAPHAEGKGQESNSSRWHKKGKGFCPVLLHGTTNRNVVTWRSSYTHAPAPFISLACPEKPAPMLLPKWEICFLSRWIAQCVLSQPYLAFSCLAPSPFRISASGV